MRVCTHCLWFMDYGVWFMVFRFRVYDLGVMVEGVDLLFLWFMDYGVFFMVFGFRVCDLGVMVEGG